MGYSMTPVSSATTLPTKPYANTGQVAILLLNLITDGLTDFNTETTPTKAQVTQYLNWVSNQIDLQFQQAGYILPFAVLTGETWSTHQSYYLELLASLGAAALAGGHTLKPAPAIGPGRGNSTGNVYQDMYNLELKKIWDGQNAQSRFRAQAYASTPAEKSITEPTGPYLDYMVGKMNPELHLSFLSYTDLRYSIQEYVEYTANYPTPIDWNDFHGLFSTKLAGYSYPSID